MKKFILLLLVVVCFPVQIVHAQIMPVVDAGLATLMEVTHLDQVIYYVQMIEQQIESVVHLVTMAEQFGQQVARTVQNLQSAKDIKSFDDFMNWYNRALYMERMTVEAFNNMNVTIGNKSYGLLDIEGMADGFNDTYVEYWKREFSPEQRKEMWLGLGLTPSNYAYVEPFRETARSFRKMSFAAPDIQNIAYLENMMRNNERQTKMAMDQLLPTEEKMGEKEVQMMILESSMENNKVLHDMAMNQARMMQQKAVEMYLEQMPVDLPAVSEDFDKTYFQKLK